MFADCFQKSDLLEHFSSLDYRWIYSDCSLETPQVRYLLSNLARDWSADGQDERDQSYGKICTELARLFEAWCAVKMFSRGF